MLLRNRSRRVAIDHDVVTALLAYRDGLATIALALVCEAHVLLGVLDALWSCARRPELRDGNNYGSWDILEVLPTVLRQLNAVCIICFAHTSGNCILAAQILIDFDTQLRCNCATATPKN